MLGWVQDIEKTTEANEYFRAVVFTAKHSQVVLMSLAPGEEIGWEVHRGIDQFFRVEEGEVRLDLGEGKDKVDEKHIAWMQLLAFVIPSGTVHKTKAEAIAAPDTKAAK